MHANTFSILGFETSFTLKQRCLDDHFTHLHIFKILIISSNNLGAMKNKIVVVNLETSFQDLTAKMGNFGVLVPTSTLH